MKELSKQINKCIRDKKTTKKTQGNTAKKSNIIPKVTYDKGETITSRSGIANVFGYFYSKLSEDENDSEKLQDLMNPEARTDKVEENNDEGSEEEMPESTEDEMQSAVNKLNKGNASDNNGIRAEDIKDCDDTTKEMIRQIFKEVIKQESCTPETWRRTRKKSYPQKTK